MFRVPQNPDTPTFDDTFKVGFFRWLTSKKTERGEWMRRRNAATRLAAENQVAKARTRQAETDADRAAWKTELEQLKASGASRKEQMAAAKRRGETVKRRRAS